MGARLASTFVLMALSGCGTVSTVFKTDNTVAKRLNEGKTYCNFIPRVYSSVSYDICVLRGDPGPDETWKPSKQVDLYVLDIALSTVFDTLGLPYTIYMQTSEGSLSLN